MHDKWYCCNDTVTKRRADYYTRIANMSIKISSEANRLKGVHLGEIKNFKKWWGIVEMGESSTDVGIITLCPLYNLNWKNLAIRNCRKIRLNQSICNDIATEILETSIINSVKAIRANKKRPDEQSLYDFVNNVNPSIDINDIANSLKTVIEIRESMCSYHVIYAF